MKIALIGINPNLANNKLQEEIIDYIKFNIIRMGGQVSLLSYFNNTFDNLKNTMSDNYDLIFYIGSDSSIYNYNIKENLSKIIGKKPTINLNIETTLKKYCQSYSLEYGTSEELMTQIPSDSIPLCNSSYYDNGFIYKQLNTYIVFLPGDISFIKSIYDPYISPILSDIIVDGRECVTLRVYGILEKDIRNLISEEMSNNNFSIQIQGNRLDNAIYIRYSSVYSDSSQNVVAEICSKLSKFIYATDDTSLYDTVVNLLKIQKKTLVLAETLTHGKITNTLANIDAGVINQGRIYGSFDAIASSLKLEPRVVGQFGKYSVNTVYELDNLLLQSSSADIAVFILGDISCDVCYIAIGDIDGIHVYKNKIIAFDNTLIDTLSDTTMFYLIKKLRQNDLQFR
jgi:nicotinamide-nucleotide amidase